MIDLKTRMVSFVLAFGIFFAVSCSTLSLTDKSPYELYNAGEMEQALSAVNQELEEYPDSTELKILKSEILKRSAKSINPISDRKPTYIEFRNTIDEIGFTTQDYQQKTDSILVNVWSYEQGEGVRLLQKDDSETYDENYEAITAHFSNAMTIIPDSLVTYSLQSTTHYRHGDTQKAIETIEDAENNDLTLTTQLKEKLAYLYLEAGYLDRSITTYEQLVTDKPGNTNFQHGLANAHILKENHSRAIEILDNLTNQYPNRIEYLEALATEKYFLLADRIETLTDQANDESIDNGNIDSILAELQILSELFDELDSKSPAREDFQLRIASFYKDAGTRLMQFSENIDSNETERLLEFGEQFVEMSLPYWQQLTELSPENPLYAQRLYESFSILGMDEEAEMIDTQINF